MSGFTFNEQHSSVHGEVSYIRRPLLPPLTDKKIEVPGMVGAYDNGIEEKSAYFEVDFRFEKEPGTLLQDQINLISEWLFTKELTKLSFDEDGGLFYYARLVGDTTPERIGTSRFVTLTFVAPKPHAYGVSVSTPLNASGTTAVSYPGTAPSFPYMVATVNEDITSLTFIKDEKYVSLGIPENVETTKVPAEEKVLNEGLESTNGWSSTTYTDGGVGTGSMTSSGSGFIVSDFGTGSSWHGPALVKALPAPVDDFKVTANFSLRSTEKDQVGRVELYVLDENGSILGKVAMKDISISEEINMGEVRVGNMVSGTYLMSDERKGAKYAWNDINGRMSIERRGNQWRGYIGRWNEDLGRYEAQQTTEWYKDTDGLWSAQMAQVVLHIAKNGERPAPPYMSFGHLSVKKYNTVTENEIPVIAEAGDVITIDFSNRKILKNGLDFRYSYDPMSNWFVLEKGTNTIEHAPSSSVAVDMTHYERWRS